MPDFSAPGITSQLISRSNSVCLIPAKVGDATSSIVISVPLSSRPFLSNL